MTPSEIQITKNIQDITPIAIVCIDAISQEIVYVNLQFRQKLGYSKKEILNKSIYSLITKANYITLANSLTCNENELEESKVVLVAKEGQHIDTVLHSTKHEDNPELIYLFFKDNRKQKEKNNLLNVYKQIFSSTKELMSLVGKDMRYITVNKAYTEHFKLSYDQIINKRVVDLHGDKADFLLEKLKYTLETGQQVRMQPKINNPNGDGVLYVDTLYSPYYNDVGNIAGVIVSARDITSFKEEEIALGKKKHYYKTLFQYSPDLLASVSLKTGVMIECNRTLENILGYEKSQLNNKHIFDFHLQEHNAKLANAIATLKHGGTISGLEISLISKSGEIVDAHLRTTPLVDIGDDVAIFVWRDIRHQKTLAYKASHDPLTQLLNRSGFLEELDKPFGSSKWKALSYIDIDNFKGLNDTFGHTIGDEFLKKFATILRYNLRKDDSICRMGGDEFVVLFKDIKFSNVKGIMQKVLSETRILVHKIPEYKQADLGISIGISEIHSTESIQLSLQQADNACYKSKRRGKNRITICDFNDNKPDSVETSQETNKKYKIESV